MGFCLLVKTQSFAYIGELDAAEITGVGVGRGGGGGGDGRWARTSLSRLPASWV